MHRRFALQNETPSQEALHAGASPRIDQAQSFLAKGDAAAAADPCGDAITDYRQAWSYAIRVKASAPVHLPKGHIQLLAEPGAPAHHSDLN